MSEHKVVVDFSGDAGHQLLHKIAIKYDLPEYVRAANPETLDTKQAGSRCGIISSKPALPCHSKAACWLSHAYYLEQRDGMPEADRQKAERYLAKEAAFWQIEDDVRKLVQREGELIKSAEATDEPYPVRSTEEAQAAGEWLLKKYADGTYAEVPVVDRINIADRVLDFDVEFQPEDMEKLARACGRIGCFDGERVASHFANLDHSDAGKIASNLKNLRGDYLSSIHTKLASCLDSFGVEGGPAELLVSQDAGEPFTVTMPSGAVYSMRDITQCKQAMSLLSSRPTLQTAGIDKLQKYAAEADPERLDQMERILAHHGVEPLAIARRQAVSTLA